MTAAALILALFPGDVPDKVAQALAIAVAPMPLESPIFASYDDSYRESLSTGKPLVVWVGQRPVNVSGVIPCYQPAFEGYPARCIIVSKPGDGELYWIATLEGTPTQKQILDALKMMPEGKQASTSWGSSTAERPAYNRQMGGATPPPQLSINPPCPRGGLLPAENPPHIAGVLTLAYDCPCGGDDRG